MEPGRNVNDFYLADQSHPVLRKTIAFHFASLSPAIQAANSTARPAQ